MENTSPRSSPLADYRVLILAGAILLIPSLFLPPFLPAMQPGALCATTSMCAGRATPWGAVFSVFLYDGWQNFPSLGLITACFVILTLNTEVKVKRRRATIAAASMFAIGVTVNVAAEYLAPMMQSFGPSGVIYALLGSLLGFTFLDMLPARPTGLSLASFYPDRRGRQRALESSLGFGGIVAFMVAAPQQFLSAGPRIDLFVHSVGMAAGFTCVLAVEQLVKRRARAPKETHYERPAWMSVEPIS